MPILFVNKQRVDIDASVATDTPLLWILRDYLNLTGTKYGCGMALCGACTVYVEGQPTRSCQTPLSALKQGADVTTIEGLTSKEGQAVQAAWEKLDVPQCGYCQSGQVMAAAALLTKTRQPTDADIDAAMQGNICRCATYVRIRAAIKEAARSPVLSEAKPGSTPASGAYPGLASLNPGYERPVTPFQDFGTTSGQET